VIIAECDIVLSCVRAEFGAAIERARDPYTEAIAKGDHSLARAKARADLVEPADAERARLETIIRNDPKADPAIWQGGGPASLFEEELPEDRDEFAAMQEAMPDLVRLHRFERRAWSRRKRTVYQLIAITSAADECADGPTTNIGL
jgi:hypothetical protein